MLKSVAFSGGWVMRIKIGILVVGLAMFLAAPLAAHHSWTADYDGGKPVSVKGVVSKVEWTNPHTHFYVDVKDEKGNVKTWNFEMASTLALERAGWSRRTLPVGAEVTVGGFGGRAVTERAIASSIVTADGKSLFVGKLGQ
jgi:hypothetical protein